MVSNWWELPCYSRCSLGNGKWFWATWDSSENLCNGHPPYSTGKSDASDEAERQAVDSLTAAFGPSEFCQRPASVASSACHRNAIKKRYARKPKETGTEQQEFLYTDDYSDYDCRKYSTAYRVVKKTKSRVYVDRDGGWCSHKSWDENGITYPDVKTFTLDRKTLEENGEVWCGRRGRQGTYYTTPCDQRRIHYALSTVVLETLGLKSNCSADDIHRAYRTLAKQTHPDHGGDVEQFKQIQVAYEQALGIIGKTPDL